MAPKTPPLTDAQRALVVDHLHIAHACACEQSRPDRDRDEVRALAYLALCHAARTFDPARSPQGEDGFGPFACQSVRLRLIRLLGLSSEERRRQALREERGGAAARPPALLGDVTTAIACNREPPWYAAARQEEQGLAAAILAALPPMHVAVLRSWFWGGTGPAEESRQRGLTVHGVLYRRRRAVKAARRALEILTGRAIDEQG